MTRLSPGRLIAAVVLVVRTRASERRFRRHQRRHEHHDECALRHGRAMAAELQWRVDLCARYRGRPGPPVPRSGSGIPLVPRPSHQIAGSPVDTIAAVPSRDGASPSPQRVEGRRSSPREEART